MTPHLPDRGQIILIDFEPAAGREIAKRRPALVLSPRRYNQLCGMVLVCPVTTKPRFGPFEVAINGPKVVGAVLADYVRSFDWRSRNASLLAPAPAGVLEETIAKLKTLIE